MKNIIYRNKLIAICMLAVLVFGQFALATHSAVHYDDISHENVAQTDDTSHSPHKHIKNKCPECLLTHAFNITDIPAIFNYPEIQSVKHTHIFTVSNLKNRRFQSYDATGPPITSI